MQDITRRGVEMASIWTIGHSTHPLELFLPMLQGHRISLLLDVRKIPRSRHNPQFNHDALPQSLASCAIAYRHEPALGGLRKPAPDSPNTGWQNPGFRAYADYMMTPAFEKQMESLVSLASTEKVALMCAEALPWRCHRSLVSDALAARGIDVLHIVTAVQARAHKLTPFARVEGTHLSYPGLVPQDALARDSEAR